MTNKVYIAFLWHNHQPYYKDDLTGKYKLPWVRLHAVKDYYDTVVILEDFPNIKMNFNLVPSLLFQIKDYVENGARDEFWDMSIKKASELTFDDKFFIIKNFFLCNWSTMVEIFPRYNQLLDIRGRAENDETLLKIAKNLGNSYFLDLQVWFNLTWIDPYFRDKDEFIKNLIKKGENFTEEEKLKVLDKHIEIMKMVIPKYKELMNKNQIEITTTPFYHPILPLLINSSISKVSSPDKQSPKNIFLQIEDAKAQISKGIDYFEKLFGQKPKGMWPSEGSVSNDALFLMSDLGIKWVASDEEVLFKSLNSHYIKEDLYNVYRFRLGNDNINDLMLIFRDKKLSDLIGFSYANMSVDAAVTDFLDNLRNIKKKLPNIEGKTNLITIILDGENCWEYFEEDGNKFLRGLYAALSDSKEFETTTISEYIEKFKMDNSDRTIDSIWPGSWINHNFNIWIGSSEKNIAWNLLYKARTFLTDYCKSKDVPKEQMQKAWEQIYIAEGSDWFWWYGDDNNSLQDSDFDFMFRKHLKNVYVILKQPSPLELDIPITSQKIEERNFAPLDFISPYINGDNSNFFKWYNAGYYPPGRTGGSMHQVSTFIKIFYYGFDLANFYMRIDINFNLNDTKKDIFFVLDFEENFQVYIKFDKDNYWFLEGFFKNESVFKLKEGYVAYDKCLELKIPFEYLKYLAKKEEDKRYSFILKVFKENFEMEHWPYHSRIHLQNPDENYFIKNLEI